MTAYNLDTFQGLRALYQECIRIYPEQQNPLQVNSRQKFWLGGPDPLDYISMYSNPGDSSRSVPPHWHYVSFGLSDLHGDGRVHPIKAREQEDMKSGFGFELTFRIKQDQNQSDPPLWPASLMQALAKYIFKSGNPLLPGDHVSWHQSLNGQESIIVHMLLARDEDFQCVNTPFGSVTFVQIIGVTADELEAIQQWNGTAFIELMKQLPQCGGEYLVTDVERNKSVFEIDPSLRGEVMAGVDRDGSNLSGVSAECSWSNDAWKFYDESNVHLLVPKFRILNISLRKQQTGFTEPNNTKTGSDGAGPSGNRFLRELRQPETLENRIPVLGEFHDVADDNLNIYDGAAESVDNRDNETRIYEASTVELEGIFNDLRMSCDSDLSSEGADKGMTYLGEIHYYDNIHIMLNLEAGLLIPLVLKGRVRHGRHFTFKSGSDDFTITLVTASILGSYATTENRFAAHGAWLHVLLDDDLTQEILSDFEVFMQSEAEGFPKTFLWPKYHFAMTINA